MAAKLLAVAVLLGAALACGSISAEYRVMTTAAARASGVEPALLMAVVWVESRYCHTQADGRLTLSPKRAMGFGQLMPSTAAALGVDPSDPQQNLNGAARYLRQMYIEWGDWRWALAAYNAGSTKLKGYGNNWPASVRGYVADVLYIYGWLKQQGY